MKIICAKIFLENATFDMINYDLQEYLKIGDSFVVYGIRFVDGYTYVYIFSNEHLFEAPINLFEIMDDNLPSWKVKTWNTTEVTLWPQLFYMEAFFENFAERELKERRLFLDLQSTIQ